MPAICIFPCAKSQWSSFSFCFHTQPHLQRYTHGRRGLCPALPTSNKKQIKPTTVHGKKKKKPPFLKIIIKHSFFSKPAGKDWKYLGRRCQTAALTKGAVHSPGLPFCLFQARKYEIIHTQLKAYLGPSSLPRSSTKPLSYGRLPFPEFPSPFWSTRKAGSQRGFKSSIISLPIGIRTKTLTMEERSSQSQSS